MTLRVQGEKDQPINDIEKDEPVNSEKNTKYGVPIAKPRSFIKRVISCVRYLSLVRTLALAMPLVTFIICLI